MNITHTRTPGCTITVIDFAPRSRTFSEVDPATIPRLDPAGYYLPTEGDLHADWQGHEGYGFQPNPRQAKLMEAAELALRAGLFYNRCVDEYVALCLGIGHEVRALKRHKTEGGDFGYDVYHARHAVEAKQEHAEADRCAALLRAEPGLLIGRAMFSDYKLVNGLTVEAVSGNGRSMTLTGKRGKNTLRWSGASVLALRSAINRANEHGKRPDNFEAFVAKRAAA